MTPVEHKRILTNLRTKATKARNELRNSHVSLAEKLVLKNNVSVADENIRLHCLNYYNIVSE